MIISSIKNNISNLKLITYSVEKLMGYTQSRVKFDLENPFLKGIYAPVSEEIFTSNLMVHGEIPSNLNGVFLRMGPNPVDVENPANYNWFAGDGMVHGVRLKEGKALWYRNRYVGTHKVHQKIGREKIKGEPRGPSDVTNTSIIGHANKIWAIVEAGAFPIELDAELNSERYGLFNSTDNYPFTAHPHLDPETGDLHAICYDVMLRSQVYYQVIDAHGKVKKRITIPVKNGPMMHDCAMTQSKMIILDLSVTFSAKSLLKGTQFPYTWNNKHQARVGLLPKNGHAKDIQWFKVDPCVIFHTFNAYDLENGDVILDSCVHEKAFTESIQGPLDQQTIKFERWTFQYATGTVKREVISEIAQEFPRFDERYIGKPYRYAYAISAAKEGEVADAANVTANDLLVHDLHTKKTLKHSYGPEFNTGEVIFIPKHANSEEGDGWLLSYIHAIDGISPSKIVILDSKKIGQEPQAVIDLPVRVPSGFHANWVADSA